METRYDYAEDSAGNAIIFPIHLEAGGEPSHRGMISEDNGRRVSAALRYFSDMSTEEIEILVKAKLPNDEDTQT